MRMEMDNIFKGFSAIEGELSVVYVAVSLADNGNIIGIVRDSKDNVDLLRASFINRVARLLDDKFASGSDLTFSFVKERYDIDANDFLMVFSCGNARGSEVAVRVHSFENIW